ncbi:MAG: hypothetical protein Q9M33_11460 [Robiginitomaculum sp.]|nr:hypothetical protein [Robiginitomaculum sp.]MDQ7077035.1 hypothetical protein [Robiginitomaculum sp.]
MANAIENAKIALAEAVKIEALAPFESKGKFVKAISGYPIKTVSKTVKYPWWLFAALACNTFQKPHTLTGFLKNSGALPQTCIISEGTPLRIRISNRGVINKYN